MEDETEATDDQPVSEQETVSEPIS
jgi:hypothetical protein